jgi:type IV pilus assembly protein PilA
MLTKLTKKDREGFTLIELMIVIAIIGILSAIAIPQFNSYRGRSFDSAATAVLRNATTAQEAYYVDNWSYSATPATLVGALYGLYTSADVVFGIASATTQAYVMTAYHPSGDTSFIIRGPGGSLSKY